MKPVFYQIVVDYRLSGFRPFEIMRMTGFTIDQVNHYIKKARKKKIVFPKLSRKHNNTPTKQPKRQTLKQFNKIMETRNKLREISKREREIVEAINQDPEHWSDHKPITGIELFTSSSLDYIFKR